MKLLHSEAFLSVVHALYISVLSKILDTIIYKHSSYVLDIIEIAAITNEVLLSKFLHKKNKNSKSTRTDCSFATHWFNTRMMSSAQANGSTSFVITQK